VSEGNFREAWVMLEQGKSIRNKPFLGALTLLVFLSDSLLSHTEREMIEPLEAIGVCDQPR
jgi:hypothetical protein